MYRIGIDVGGTFTDLVAVDERGQVTLAKAALILEVKYSPPYWVHAVI